MHFYLLNKRIWLEVELLSQDTCQDELSIVNLWKTKKKNKLSNRLLHKTEHTYISVVVTLWSVCFYAKIHANIATISALPLQKMFLYPNNDHNFHKMLTLTLFWLVKIDVCVILTSFMDRVFTYGSSYTFNM